MIQIIWEINYLGWSNKIDIIKDNCETRRINTNYWLAQPEGITSNGGDSWCDLTYEEAD